MSHSQLCQDRILYQTMDASNRCAKTASHAIIRERQKVGGQATLRSGSCVCGCGLNFGYQRRNRSSRSSLRTLFLVCSKRCAPRVHCICCFLTNRLLTTWLIVESTNAVLTVSPCCRRSPKFGLAVIADVCSKVIEASTNLLRSVRTGLSETQLH
jgi:hypothetical protein